MEYGLLLVIAVVVGGGVAGGLLASWNCHRRQLALEQMVKTLQLVYDTRLDKLQEVVTSRVKSDASKVRWSKKELEDQALAQTLTKRDENPWPAAWDPRTFNGA
jgi:hypothetical protein